MANVVVMALAADDVTFPITFDDEANELLAHDPLALLYGMLLDQQVPMTWAFKSPLTIKERLGDRWSPAAIAAMDPDELVELFCEKPAVHRYPAAMARRAHGIAVEIVEHYDGDTERIWTTATTGKQLYDRLSVLPGFAEEKTQIFVALLAKRFGVTPADGRPQRVRSPTVSRVRRRTCRARRSSTRCGPGRRRRRPRRSRSPSSRCRPPAGSRTERSLRPPAPRRGRPVRRSAAATATRGTSRPRGGRVAARGRHR